MTAAAAEHSGTVRHAAAVSADELDVPDVIDDAHISRARAAMMAALADAVTAHELAADHLGSLRGPLCDLDLSDSHDGHDYPAPTRRGRARSRPAPWLGGLSALLSLRCIQRQVDIPAAACGDTWAWQTNPLLTCQRARPGRVPP